MEDSILTEVVEMKDLTRPLRGRKILETTHWFAGKAIQIVPDGSKPIGIREWSRCFWNIDLFFGPVPVLKLLGLVSIIGWIL